LEGNGEDDEKEGNFLDISVSDINEDLWKVVSQFAPFGMGNEKPVFKINKALIKSVKNFGKEANHLEITLNGKGSGLKAISFFKTMDSYETPLSPGVPINLVANLEKSYFRNRPELRLRIVDII